MIDFGKSWFAVGLPVVLSTFLLIVGCGGVNVTRITDATYTEGVRYWDSLPYMTSYGTVVWLPDPTRGYVIKPKWSLFSSTSLNVSVIDGWQLSGLGAAQSPQVLPFVQGVGQTVAGKLMRGKFGSAPPPVELYPLRWIPEQGGRPGYWKVGQ